MMNYVQFQTQITNVMEIMSTSAIAEISKIFDDSSSVLCLKISRCLHENGALKKKLQTLQRELKMARGHKEGVITGARESPVNTRSVGVQALVQEQHRERGFVQEWSVSLRRDGEHAGVEQFADMEKVKPEPVPIKQERLEEGLCYRNTQPTPGGEGQVTPPTPAGDPEELSEQHRCEYSDEELSGLEFVVKAEQEEDVVQRLNQAGYENSAGRLNNLGSEYVMYERDSQLWTSFTQVVSDIQTDGPVCSNATDQFSQNMSIHTELQYTPATMEVSGHALSSFGASYVEEFDEMIEKPSACSEDLRSEVIHTQQGQYRERLVHSLARENQTLLPQQQQQHGPSVTHMRGSESPAHPHSGSQYETGSTPGTSAFNAGKKGRIDGQACFRKKSFICIYCGKAFDCSSSLTSHHRIHTGGKPFSCTQCGRCFNRKSNLAQHERIHSGFKPYACKLCGKRFTRVPDLRAHHRCHTGERPYRCGQCGKCFSLKGNLVQHERVHSGNKPFGCAQCGKRFVRRANLRAHQRSHTGERPYSCAQCGKSFARHSNLLVHQRIHAKVKPYSCI